LEPKDEEPGIRFALGDFLHRIPPQLLREGPHQADFDLYFDADGLARRIAHGSTTIPLTEIYKRAPHIFRHEVRASDKIEIRFPWQKLMSYLRPEAGEARNQSLSEVAAELAAKVRSQKPAEQRVSGDAVTVPAIAEKEVVEFLPPADRSDPDVDKPPLFLPATASSATDPELPLDLKDVQPLPSLTTRSSDQSHPSQPSASKNALEEKIATLNQERQAIVAQRDKLATELEQARGVIEEKSQQIELEKGVAGRGDEHLAELEDVRATLQKKLDDEMRAREELAAQLKEAKRQGEEKVSTIAEERDALLQQKSHLSEQLAQVQHRRGVAALQAAAGGEAGESGVSGGAPLERSKREYQRQIDELHRRIAAFENNQKEAAHELSKEREARIKVERALTAAERARAEASALVESMRVETRRELDSGLRKRESEFARAQQELQEQLETLAQEKERSSRSKRRPSPGLRKSRNGAKPNGNNCLRKWRSNTRARPWNDRNCIRASPSWNTQPPPLPHTSTAEAIGNRVPLPAWSRTSRTIDAASRCCSKNATNGAKSGRIWPLS
jgi:hypothetical protein